MNVTALHDTRSVGVARYCSRLVDPLAALGINYLPSETTRLGFATHFHLANSSRRVAWRAAVDGGVVTVHDVVPRNRLLLPLYRALIYPGVVRRAKGIIVHSAFAAEMLRRAGRISARLEVIPHSAPRPKSTDRHAAREALGWPTGGEVVVLPGVIKSAKLVREVVEATAPLVRDGVLRLALAGGVTDQGVARAARAAGAWIVESPDDLTYERVIVASDVVLVLRSRSVGETNGPLLDALGAGRAVLATRVGSIPEIAGRAAMYCDPEAGSIRRSLLELLDPDARAARERLSVTRGEALSPESAASMHAELFRELFGG